MKRTIDKKTMLKAGIAVAIALLFVMPVSAMTLEKQGNSMTAESVSGSPGQTGIEVEITGEWAQTISGYSIGMQYDSSIIEIADVSAVGTIAEDAFIFNWNIPTPGVFSLGVAWMLPSDYKPAGSGILVKLYINISGSASPGTTILDLGDFGGSPPVTCLYSDASSSAIAPDVLTDGIVTIASSVLCGDMNEDKKVNIVDLTYLVSYLFGGGPEPVPPCAGDVNDDNKINIVDLTYLVSYLFGGGPEPDPNCCNPPW